MDIKLSESESTIVHDVLKNYLSELHTEISYTDDRDFKAALRKRHDILQSALNKLAASIEQPV